MFPFFGEKSFKLGAMATLIATMALTGSLKAQEQNDDERPGRLIEGPRHLLNRDRSLNANRQRAFESIRARRALREQMPVIERNNDNDNNNNSDDQTQSDSSSSATSEPTKVAQATPSASQAAGNKNSPAAGNEEETTIDYAARSRKGKFYFDFNKAAIEDVIRAISDITRRNFIVPEKIKGQKLTILCPTQVTAYEAYQAFLSALEINNLTLVRSGKFYKLTSSKEAIKAPIPTYYNDAKNVPRNDSLVTILMQLKYVDAQNISNIIKGMISSDGSMTVFQPTNTLILSDYGNNIHRVKGIIDSLDQAGGKEELKIIPVENATASEVAEKLKQIYDVDKKQAAGSSNRSSSNNNNNKTGNDDNSGSSVNISKIIPDDRTNQLFILANHDSFEPIMDIISKLDVTLTEDEGQIRVYYLKNATAEDIANTLSSLAQGNSNSNKNKKPANSKNKTTNDSAALFEGEVKITADKATNSLVIISSARDYKSLKKVIDQLDRPRLQVYIEAAIMEVTVSKNNQFGTGWHTGIPFDQGSGNKNLSQGIGFVQSSSNSTMTAMTSASGVADLFNIFGGAIGGVLGEMFTGTIAGTSVTIPSFGVVLKALQNNSNSKIISTPHITTADNEEAEIEVGQKIPFQEGYGSTLSNLSGLSSSASSALSAYAGLYSRTDRIDVSLKLNLTPHINDSGKVRLEVDLSIEDLVGKDEATGQPITATRKAKTVITPDDQQTVVIGGLVRDRIRESESKIPLLGNIPILGWLFKTRSWETEKVNLLLILTPYIIRDKSDFRAIAKRKMEEHERFAKMFYGGSKPYRAYVNYSRKNGLAATLLSEIENEMTRIENGGNGNGEETLIEPTPMAAEFDEVNEELSGDHKAAAESNAAAAKDSDESAQNKNDSAASNQENNVGNSAASGTIEEQNGESDEANL